MMPDERIDLSPSREFCLRAVAKGCQTAQRVSIEAMYEGMNRRRLARFEWADQPMRWLRKKRLVVRDGKLGRFWAHKITEKGMDVLARIEAERGG